ncbi:MAG: SDR family NAD(P)-dependent oxidoreductase, partial [Oxalobacteraceae bacterium]
MEISMSGRTAIVTGGSKGIGYAIATRFVASGADVLICARGKDALDEAVKSIGEAAKADKTKGSNRVGRIAACAGDVAKPEDVKRIYDEAMKAFGKVDILVNNAGVSRAGAFETLTDERMQEDLDQKLFAAIRMTRLVWPQMKERRWGRVINVLNIGAKSPRGNSAPTSVTRAAGMALTKVLANEGAPHNVLVNALLVG